MYHGNYCGPFNSMDVPIIDGMDEICKIHDMSMSNFWDNTVDARNADFEFIQKMIKLRDTYGVFEMKWHKANTMVVAIQNIYKLKQMYAGTRAEGGQGFLEQLEKDLNSDSIQLTAYKAELANLKRKLEDISSTVDYSQLKKGKKEEEKKSFLKNAKKVQAFEQIQKAFKKKKFSRNKKFKRRRRKRVKAYIYM